MTTLNEQRMEAKSLFEGYKGIQDTFTEMNSTQSIINAQNGKMTELKKKYEFVGDDRNSRDGTVAGMKKKFIEAEKKILLESEAQLIRPVPPGTPNPLAPYKNCLPYGVRNPTDVNTELYDINEKKWEDFHGRFKKIFTSIGKTQVQILEQNSSQNINTISAFLKSFSGSVSEWPDINPLSGGIGSCNTLYALFNKYYMEYQGGIEPENFYQELIGSLHTSHIHSIYKKANKTKFETPKNFGKTINAYNFDTSMWFKLDEPTDVQKELYKYNGFLDVQKDSYGQIFSCGGLPVSLANYRTYGILRGDTNLRVLSNNQYETIETLYNFYQTPGNEGKNEEVGSYKRLYIDADYNNLLSIKNIVVVKGVKVIGTEFGEIDKKFCMLYRRELEKGQINKQIEINDPKEYLFNSKSKCVSPFAFSTTPNSSTWCKDDILYSQRHRGVFVLLFIRLILQKLYPIGQDDRQAVAYAAGANINIFGPSANNPNLTLALHAGSISTASLSFDACKNEIKTEFKKYESIFNEFDKLGFTELMNFINISKNDPVSEDSGITHGNNQNRLFYKFQIIGEINVIDINATVGHLIGNDDLVATPDVDTLIPANQIHPEFTIYPVLMYRFLMSRMVRYYKNNATTDHLIDTSKDNLYQTTENIQFTNAKLLATYDNLIPVIQNIIPDIITQVAGTKSKTSKKSLPAIGGKKPKLRKQKGGTSNHIFQIDATPATPASYPKLFANRVEEPFNPNQFKEAVKKFMSEKLDSDHTKVIGLFNKFAHIDNLPLFYDGYDDRLDIHSTVNNGGATIGTIGGGNKIVSFTEIAQLFLYNSVITNSTRLLIHFFSNIKACLEHFIKTELIPIIDKVKTSESQHEKVKINLEQLVEEVRKLINFLKYNGINLQDRTPVFDNGQVVNFKIPKNSYYIKNLFLGSGTFVAVNNAGAGALNDHIQNYFCQQPTMFSFLNKLLFINKYGKFDYMMFSNALKFLTDSNQPDAEFVGLNTIYGVVSPYLPPAVAQKSDYIKEFGQYIKARPNVCFGGVPVVFFDRRNISLLMRSFFFLLEFRIDVGNKLKTNYLIKEELAFSELEPAKRKEIFDDIIKTFPVSYLKTLAINLGNKNEKHAIIKYTAIFTYIYKHLNKLIIRIDKKHAEYVKSQRNVNPNKKKSILNYNSSGGEPAPFSLYGIRASNNIKMNEVKQAIDFIKEKYQVEAEFDYLIEKLTEYIRIELKNNIRDSNIKNIAFYYVDTHIRNFKIYLDTYLLTLSDSNIPQETKDKLRQYVGFKPAMVNNKMNLDAMKETFNKLLTNTLINPQYTDPIWWSKIEYNFMKINEKDISNTSKVYRLFIITTQMGLSLMRDLYLVDAFALASSNDSRSYDDLSGTTGYRTHGNIKTYKVSNGTKEVYNSSNTIIKLTGVKGLQLNSVRWTKFRKRWWNKTFGKLTGSNRSDNEIEKQSINEVIQEDIRKLIDGEYLYYDSITMSYKKLIPIFLQADDSSKLSRILTYQKQHLFPEDYKTKINDELTSYTLYNLQDKQIKDIKKYRKWLYQIMFEEQMKLELTTKQKTIYDTNITTTAIKIFKGKLFGTTDLTGKCDRVLNIYDYAITKSRVNTSVLAPQPLLAEPIQREEMKYTIDMGAIKFGRFISRDDLIKLMLLY
jgi:hypothetical protein